MYSGDANGVIMIWNVHVTEQPSRRGFLKDWTLYKEVVEEECKVSFKGFVYLLLYRVSVKECWFQNSIRVVAYS